VVVLLFTIFPVLINTMRGVREIDPRLVEVAHAFCSAGTEQSLPKRFAQQVGHYPQRLAVMDHYSGLTYMALDQAANRVAQAILARHGAEPALVALLLGHDTPLIAAMLGVLKAGKICVPLAPQAPLAG
jgi:surfactin family lipopeptide synthetase A